MKHKNNEVFLFGKQLNQIYSKQSNKWVQHPLNGQLCQLFINKDAVFFGVDLYWFKKCNKIYQISETKLTKEVKLLIVFFFFQ